VRRWRDTRSHLWWVSTVLAPLVIGRSSTTTTLAAAAGIALLVIVFVIAVVALGAAFGGSTERREACLRTLRALLRPSPWTDKK
jgi:uncharacterized membrane protein YhaH (DUF805 family)